MRNLYARHINLRNQFRRLPGCRFFFLFSRMKRKEKRKKRRASFGLPGQNETRRFPPLVFSLCLFGTAVPLLAHLSTSFILDGFIIPINSEKSKRIDKMNQKTEREAPPCRKALFPGVCKSFRICFRFASFLPFDYGSSSSAGGLRRRPAGAEPHGDIPKFPAPPRIIRGGCPANDHAHPYARCFC